MALVEPGLFSPHAATIDCSLANHSWPAQCSLGPLGWSPTTGSTDARSCAVGCNALACRVALPTQAARNLRLGEGATHSTWCAATSALHLNALRAGAALGVHGALAAFTTDADDPETGAPSFGPLGTNEPPLALPAAAAAAALLPAQRDAWWRFSEAALRLPTWHARCSHGGVTASTPTLPAPRAQLVALGGSMVAGQLCNDGEATNANCAYPHRLAAALDALAGATKAPAAPLAFTSLASGGTSSLSTLASLGPLLAPFGADAAAGLPTLLVVDFSANDLAGGLDVLSSTEALVRHVLGELPSVALMLVETFHGLGHGLHPKPTAVKRTALAAYRAIGLRYGVPVVRYEQVINDERLAWQRATIGGDGREAVHPPWHTHELIATTLLHSMLLIADAIRADVAGADALPEVPKRATKGMLQAEVDLEEQRLRQRRPAAPCVAPPLRSSNGSAATAAESTLPPPLSRPERLKDLAVCRTALSRYGVGSVSGGLGGVGSGARVLSGDWRFYEDVPGKPGWIATRNGSTIAFPLAFGAMPRATLSYLQGYADAHTHHDTHEFTHAPAWGEAELRLADVTIAVPRAVPVVDGVEAWRPPEGRGLRVGTLRGGLWERVHARVDGQRSDSQRVTQAAFLGIAAAAAKMENYAMDPTVPRDYPGIVGFGAPPSSNATLTVTLRCDAGRRHSHGGAQDDGCKFKLLALTSC